jgi:hypothetical protein
MLPDMSQYSLSTSSEQSMEGEVDLISSPRGNTPAISRAIRRETNERNSRRTRKVRKVQSCQSVQRRRGSLV